MAGTLAAAAYVWAGDTFLLDDAFIHLAYAKSIALGEGLSYNPGDFETGGTSLLWIALLVPFARMDDPVLAVKLLGASMHGLCAAFAALLAFALACARLPSTSEQQARDASRCALVCGALVACSPLQLYGATSGMETSLASATLLAAVWALVTSRSALAFVFAFLSPLARPELSLVLLSLGGLCALRSENRRCALSLAAGALSGQAASCLYMLAVSGFAFPNTYYVKARSGGLSGFGYFARIVLVREAWVCSLTGVLLWGRGLWRELAQKHATLALIQVAAFVGVAAIAFSRAFRPAVLFWQWRYFAPLMPLLIVPVAFGLMGVVRRLWWYGTLLPIVASTLWLCAAAWVEYEGQSGDVASHVALARWLAEHLPADARVGVEAAGASRFFTPRSMRIIDLEGLNDRGLAHVRFDPARRIAEIHARQPTHMAVPDSWLPVLGPEFGIKGITELTDPESWDGERHGRNRIVVGTVGR